MTSENPNPPRSLAGYVSKIHYEGKRPLSEKEVARLRRVARETDERNAQKSTPEESS